MKNILICENEQLFANHLKEFLESNGFFVLTTEGPSEAVKNVLKKEFDAIVLNLKSNYIDSTQAFYAIRMINNKIPVIVIADNNEPLSSASSIIHEAFRYFSKPVSVEEIKEAINEAIHEKC